MKVSRLRKGLLLVVAASALGLGCELIVDFDRTKIPVEGSDGAPSIDGSFDAQFDTTQQDTSTADAADAANAVDAFDAADAAETDQ